MAVIHSKLAFHDLRMPAPWVLDLWRSAPFRWGKIKDPGGDKSPVPGCNIIGRVYTKQADDDRWLSLGAAGAESWYAVVRSKMLECRWVKVWELINEPTNKTRMQCINIANYTRRAVDLMHADGLLVATGVFSRGTPQLAASVPSECFLRELQPVFEYGDYVALHQYGLSPMTKDAEWTVLRHRLLLKELKALGITCKPILVTEGGIDAPGGWKTCNISEQQYWDQLLWCDNEYEKDDAIVCWTPYTLEPPPDWEPFVITQWLATKMVQEVRMHPPVIEGAPMPPNPCPGVIQEPPIKIDGRCLTVDQFKAHARSLVWPAATKPNVIFLHHTGIPALADWHGYPTLIAMKTYYEHQQWKDSHGCWHSGWTAGPHIFVGPDGIWLFTSLTEEGVHAGDPYNFRSIGLEMVGNYDPAPPVGPVLASTVAALGILYQTLGLDPSGLRFHREVSSKTCPGTAVQKLWVVGLVKGWIAAQQPPHQGMPEDETATDAPTLAVKCRWWLEESIRQDESGQLGLARATRYSLVKLFYRLENALQAATSS